MTLTQIKPAGLSKPVDLADNEKIRLGTGNDLEIYHSGTQSYIQDTGTGNLNLQGTSKVVIGNAAIDENMAQFFVDGEVALYYNNVKKFETTSAGATVTGSLGIGTTSPARLLHQHLSSSAANYHLFTNDTTGSNATDGLLLGINSSEEAIIWNYENTDMRIATNNSDCLTIKSNGNIQIPADNKKLQFGASQDLEIYHDGTDSYCKNSTGQLKFLINGNENAIVAHPNSGVELYADNTKRFETGSLGVRYFGNVYASDNYKLLLGDAQDLEIYHNSGFSYIDAKGDQLRIEADQLRVRSDSGESYIEADANSAVKLYFDNSKKFETTSSGATVSGELTVNSHLLMGDGDKLRLGDSNDLELHHSGGENYIQGHTNQLYVRSAQGVYIQPNTNENGVVCNANSSTELYHNNTKKFETLSNGTRVYGHLGVNRDPAGSHPLWVQGSNQYVIGLTNTSAHASYFPWLLHKSINSLQAFGVHFNGLSGDPFHVDQNGAIYLGKQTATANALDDYEEGTWTPSVHNGGGSLTTVVARYTKIGRLVHIQAYVNYTTANSTSAFQMGGLPFACLGNDYNTCVTDFGRGGKKGAYSRTHTGNTFMEFLYSSESTSSDRITLKGNQIGSSYIIVSNTYMTS